jgi:glutamyl-tRNA synthetase
MTVVTRFAPSPTGFLHIGGARTALFNWLYAKAKGGKFLLRVEDTDRARSTPEAIDAIVAGMRWLGLDWDGEEFYQFARAERHKEVAEQLLKEGKAYHCYCSPEELEVMREKAKEEKRSFRYDGTWRDRDASEAPAGVAPVVRLKAPLTGETTVADEVQGTVTVQNEQLDDMILLRSDGTPTYMLAVVVDDHDMGVTHVIRGDDHFTNSFRQTLLYQACGWEVPSFTHIPLIHGSDGAKLSKRHGALGVDAYEEMGYLPEAIRNYLLRLGWSHGDEEIISTEQAIQWFDLEHVGKSPSRFDFDKLTHLNGHYIREADNERLVNLVEAKLGKTLDEVQRARLQAGMEGLKQRAKTINELTEAGAFYLDVPTEFTEKAQKTLDDAGKALLAQAITQLEACDNWNHEQLEAAMQAVCEQAETKLGKVMGPIRSAITGSHMSPSMFEVMEVLGKEETLKRLKAVS